jgi:formylglycine-generating enzyme required for sulfatase activity
VRGAWITVTADTFDMGSPDAEPGRDTDEAQHSVELTRNFLVFSTEVTQEWFETVMGLNPSSFPACGNDCPVDNVSWHQAAEFCNWMSSHDSAPSCYECDGAGPDRQCALATGYDKPQDCNGYRLPTEAEWEFVARATSTGSTYNGTLDPGQLACEQPNPVADDIMWFCGNAGGTTHPAGGKDPNTWLVHDVLGNAAEWCHDWYGAYPGDDVDPWGPDTGDRRAVRGGQYDDDAGSCRAAARDSEPPGSSRAGLGFRVVLGQP